MKDIKKGIEPKKEDNTQTQLHISKISSICLLLFFVFLVLIYIGEYTGNNCLEALGIGIGVSAGLIQAKINLEGDNDR